MIIEGTKVPGDTAREHLDALVKEGLVVEYLPDNWRLTDFARDNADKLFTQQQWFLQANCSGQQFWDNYLHSDCKMLSSQIFDWPNTPFTTQA